MIRIIYIQIFSRREFRVSKGTLLAGKDLRGQVFILDIYCPLSYEDPNHLQQVGKVNLY
jgi:hypothetical protein